MGTTHSGIVSKFHGGTPSIPNGPVGQAPVWKDVFDALRALRDGVLSELRWSGDFAVSGSAANNFTVEIGAISCAWVQDGAGDYVPLAYGGGSITQTSVEGGGGTLGAAADTWYVYVSSSAGTAAFEISQTAPNANKQTKGVDLTRRYLGCFLTDGSGVPQAVRACHGDYVYVAQQNVASALKSNSATAVSLASRIPAHARIAKVNLRTYKPNPGDPARSCVVSGVAIHSASVATGEEGYTETAAEVVLSSSQEVTYQWTTQDATPGEESELAIDAIGWRE